jgi:hypothetical protein
MPRRIHLRIPGSHTSSKEESARPIGISVSHAAAHRYLTAPITPRKLSLALAGDLPERPLCMLRSGASTLWKNNFPAPGACGSIAVGRFRFQSANS